MTPLQEPPVTKELVEWAERAFPDRCPDPSMSNRAVWMAAGAAKVARKLRAMYDAQARKALVG